MQFHPSALSFREPLEATCHMGFKLPAEEGAEKTEGMSFKQREKKAPSPKISKHLKALIMFC